jgi:hypothetical protein
MYVNKHSKSKAIHGSTPVLIIIYLRITKGLCRKKTTAHSQNIVHVDALHNIKRKKHKTVGAELAFFLIELVMFSLFVREYITRANQV